MKTIKDINFKDKTVLVRVDYNVPIENNKVTSDLRIRASLPTLNYLREHGTKKIILISHLGRPSKDSAPISLAPVAAILNKLIGHVTFCDQIYGNTVEEAVDNLNTGDILLLENLRSDAGEEQNSEDFIHHIISSTGAEIYVQDGFAVIHRAHASTDAVKHFLPIYAGLLMEKEVQNLTKAAKNPKPPVLLIIGGAKVEDKQPLIDNFLPIADYIFVGGKIAADGYQATNNKIYVAEDFDEDSNGRKLDVGPIATAKLAEYISKANTIIWNGLLGYAEDPTYATASTIAAQAIGERSPATTIICGGDTTGFVEYLMESNSDLHYSLVSTGGGAALEFLLGKPLPGLENIAQ